MIVQRPEEYFSIDWKNCKRVVILKRIRKLPGVVAEYSRLPGRRTSRNPTRCRDHSRDTSPPPWKQDAPVGSKQVRTYSDRNHRPVLRAESAILQHNSPLSSCDRVAWATVKPPPKFDWSLFTKSTPLHTPFQTLYVVLFNHFISRYSTFSYQTMLFYITKHD